MSDTSTRNAGEQTSGDADERMQQALTEVKREGYKVATIYASVDAALVALVVSLVLRVGGTEALSLPAALPLPTALATTGTSVATSIVLGVVAGAVVFVTEFVVRTRRPLVEQFEAANPEVREALRTARDSLRAGRESQMTARLYEDVIDRLGRSSSGGLVSVRRVSVTVVLVLVVSLASIQVTVVGLELSDLGGADGPAGGDAQRPPEEFDGLEAGDQILGDAENVTAGDNALDAEVGSQGSGEGNETDSGGFSSGGFGGATDVESQQAGFVDEGTVEDAELIREYNLRIRADDDEEDT